MLGNPRNYFFGVGEGGGGGERIPESWDLESTDKDLESSTEYLELGATEWNPEYKTALDPLPNGINRMSYQP